ncbi:MAG: indolepyruvate oxidoreductase subunit beta [Coriobacteriia bacterium]|nr:indolepyruvate oxidoreductase subunit beta [Coriobacteriia bacterium]
MSNDIIIAGVGGQGTVLASRLIAYAAMLEGKTVRTAETIGMSQRGGSVLGYIRIFSDDDGYAPLSPMIYSGQADLLMAFEPAEAARNLHLLKAGGSLVTACKGIMPIQAQLAKDPSEVYDVEKLLAWLEAKSTAADLPAYQAYLIDGEAILEKLGSGRVLNVVLLGVAIATGALAISEDSLVSAIQALAPARYLEMNIKALGEGKAQANERPTMGADT